MFKSFLLHARIGSRTLAQQCAVSTASSSIVCSSRHLHGSSRVPSSSSSSSHNSSRGAGGDSESVKHCHPLSTEKETPPTSSSTSTSSVLGRLPSSVTRTTTTAAAAGTAWWEWAPIFARTPLPSTSTSSSSCSTLAGAEGDGESHTPHTHTATSPDNAIFPTRTSRWSFALQPHRPCRVATIFIDADMLSAEAVDAMCSALNIDKRTSRLYIARQPHTTPLSVIDDCAPTHVFVPTPMLIEQKAREWLQFGMKSTSTSSSTPTSSAHEVRGKPGSHQSTEGMTQKDAAPPSLHCYTASAAPILQLHDVVYMCANSQWSLYASHILPLHPVPDADVYLACPAQVELLYPKQWRLAFY